MSSVSSRLAMTSVALVVALLFSGSASAQQLNWLWWKMEPTLTLTPEQSDKIDVIFQAGINQLQKQKADLDRLESKLSRLIETMASEAEVTQQIDRVEAARSTMNKTRTLMLLHMRQELKPEQRLKLNALRDRREKERKAVEERLQRQRDSERLQTPDASKRPDTAAKRQN